MGKKPINRRDKWTTSIGAPARDTQPTFVAKVRGSWVREAGSRGLERGSWMEREVSLSPTESGEPWEWVLWLRLCHSGSWGEINLQERRGQQSYPSVF